MNFNTDFEYDQWFEQKQAEQVLENYFGREVEKEDGRNKSTTD